MFDCGIGFLLGSCFGFLLGRRLRCLEGGVALLQPRASVEQPGAVIPLALDGLPQPRAPDPDNVPKKPPPPLPPDTPKLPPWRHRTPFYFSCHQLPPLPNAPKKPPPPLPLGPLATGRTPGPPKKPPPLLDLGQQPTG